MQISILVKPFNIGIADHETIIKFKLSEKFNSETKALNRVVKYLEKNYETDFSLVESLENDTFRKYDLRGRGGYITMQIIGRTEA